MSILLFGEIVWDDITENGGSGKPERLGGAPMNVAAHCARLGVPAQMCSALDQDALGKMALEQVCALGVGTDLVNIVSQETCLIKVSFGENGEPSYHIPEDVSWDHITAPWLHAARKAGGLWKICLGMGISQGCTVT